MSVRDPKKFLMYPRFIQCILNSLLPDVAAYGNPLPLQHHGADTFGKMHIKHKANTFEGENVEISQMIWDLQDALIDVQQGNQDEDEVASPVAVKQHASPTVQEQQEDQVASPAAVDPLASIDAMSSPAPAAETQGGVSWRC